MQHIIDIFSRQLENQFLSGGLVLMITGAILALGRNIPNKILSLLNRYLILTIDIPDHDTTFDWFRNWLSSIEYSKRTKLLTMSNVTGIDITDSLSSSSVEIEEEKFPGICLSPAPGIHILRYNGHWIMVSRERREVDHDGYRSFRETFVLRTITGTRDTINSIMEEAWKISIPTSERKFFNIYVSNLDTWSVLSTKSIRDINSVILADNMIERICNELDEFMNMREWYTSLGIPYKIGYLLYGPPGNGKSSLVAALASYLKMDIYMPRLNGISQYAFNSLMLSMPQRSILLIEDIDCLFDNRDNKDKNILSFSSFINTIDGISSAEGRILFITTNHPEKLDDALKRPGRLDKHIYIGNANVEQMEKLFRRFFPDACVKHVYKFTQANKNKNLSMASIQEHLIRNKHSIDSAATEIDI